MIGEPGSYLRDGWQTAFIPHYAASFLGAAEAAYDYAVEYLVHQGKGGDPYVQQRVGEHAGERRVGAPVAAARRRALGPRRSRRRRSSPAAAPAT